jgi:hypothetical protein
VSRIGQVVLDALIAQKRDPIYNYIIPGLTSWNLAESPEQTIRLYESSREQIQAITPHSHRSKLQCYVLSGSVVNLIWHRSDRSTGEPWFANQLVYNGKPGEYTKIQAKTSEIWWYSRHAYVVGQDYEMEHDVVHSIVFSANTRLLLIKVPEVTNTTTILEPEAYGKCIPTLHVEPWMYKK